MHYTSTLVSSPSNLPGYKTGDTISMGDGSAWVYYEGAGWVPDVSSGAAFAAPKPSGNDDTAVLQDFLDTMGAEAAASKRRRTVELYGQAPYLVSGLWHPEFVHIKGNGTTLIKTANAAYIPNGLHISPLSSVIRAKWNKKNGSWYGSARFMGLEDITLDSNNKDYLAVMEYFNVENLLLKDVTIIAGLWAQNWSTRIGGKNITIVNPRVLGATRVFQDALHISFGENIHVLGGYLESGDDGLAFGDDQVTANEYYDDQGLKNFSATGVTCLSTRGAGCKVYVPATKPFASALGYTKTGRVSGGRVSFTGRVGQLRNGGVSLMNHATPDTSVISDLRDVHVKANLDVGTDGAGVYSAVPGTLIGSPTAVSLASEAIVTLNGHGLTTGKVVSFINIPSTGMQNLTGFYQVRIPTANTFGLSDIAYRSGVGLNSTTFAPWTSGQLIHVSSGTGYTVGDDLTLAGGSVQEAAVFRVTQVGPNGEVEAVRPISRGKYTSLPATPNLPTGGTGTGCQLFLELTHSGVNAYGVSSVGTMDTSIEASLVINDTTGSSTRFGVGYLQDVQGTQTTVNCLNVPGNGGVQLVNSSLVHKTRDNIITGHLVSNADVSPSVGHVSLANARNTTLRDCLLENVQTNAAAINFAFTGNFWQEHVLVSAVDGVDGFGSYECPIGTPAVGWRVGDYVGIFDNVLSGGGSLNGYYWIYKMFGETTIYLKDFNNEVVGLRGATITTPGRTALTQNTVTLERVTVRGGASSYGVGAASAAPVRGNGLIIKDSDFSGVATPVGPNVMNLPVVSVTNTLGISCDTRVYKSAAVTHSMLTSRKIILQPSANLTINAPTSARKGDELDITIVHPAGGAVTVTWASVFKKAADGTATAASSGSTRFVYNGTNWVQKGGALTYFA